MILKNMKRCLTSLIIKEMIPFNLAYGLLKIYPKDIPPTFQENICTKLSTAALFVIANYLNVQA